MAKGQMRSNKEKKKPKQDKDKKGGAGPSLFGQNPNAAAPPTTSYKSQYGKKG